MLALGKKEYPSNYTFLAGSKNLKICIQTQFFNGESEFATFRLVAGGVRPLEVTKNHRLNDAAMLGGHPWEQAQVVRSKC